ncbi:HypC/HybG/HupF family hydrogenase formation chaperone [Fodinicola acaciae]|uniref:HypC/HybG/HupF family hydrogenase formation chaperone n=1 Tax=Fodinicola acaciae TaxID=2681555 RepID=UPI0013D3D647|nr:HypC/HybG/HupF family hydrogenase formation chaperone [Fodinicola acaciae]
MCLGIPGRIVRVTDDDLRTAVVDFDGLERTVCLAYTPEAGAGDYVIVHVGFAISRVDEAEAARTFAVLKAIPDALDAELGPRR